MCYSAMVEADLREAEREYDALIARKMFAHLFRRRVEDDYIKIPKAVELAFENPRNAEEVEIKLSIDQYRAKKTRELELELFKQKKRLGDAERGLKTRVTKKAQNDQRIATDKIEALVKRIGDVNRTERRERDARIFPFHYAPIVIDEGKGRQIIPARYHCRPFGKPEFLDKQFDGLYNARRDSLEKFWKDLFGRHHAVCPMTSFYENVALHRFDHRELRPDEKERNVILHFNPRPAIRMHVACVWSRWSDDLVSFAAITDEPPPEIAAAGHDRVVIALKRANVESWLSPTGVDRALLYKLFDDREAPYYEHQRIAA
ncbi:MAG TPA: SOS response-associated peptidase family protein [Steroidobacteraceae bacterium]|nr:SOS response-associated peptidase family protein [Steroidobacteraceae bacterium]